ncbi:MAG: hypothetical protein FD166_2732 [Bacteroidetes bacterium]|nr:MAG: hypothetical protein FD166_2732 [Bacteroidota bacterium]
MPQVIKIPHLNHLHFHRYPSESFAPDVIPSFEEDRIYLQKFVRNIDEIYFQVHVIPDFVTSIGFYLEGVDGTTLPLTGSSVGSLNGYDIWHIYSDNFWTLPAGVYFVVLEVTVNMGLDDIVKKYVSEPVKMVESLPESLLIKYSHGRNEFDFAFYPDGTPESKRSYFLRIEGGVMSDGFNPGSKDSYFVDQDREVLLLDSRPFNVYEFTFGPGSGLPNWMADKINRILSLSDIRINNESYVKNEGAKLEPVRDKGYPLAGWKIEMVKSETDDAIIED